MRNRWLNRILIPNIVVQSGIIVTGAIVRVSGSGLGCPSWPQCTQGSYVPTIHQAESWHKWVEYSNRLLTGVLMIVAISVLFGVLMYTRDTRSRWLAAAPLGLTFGQAILGGITVLTGLNPYTVSAHFLLSTFIVHLSVRLWWRVQNDNHALPLTQRSKALLISAWVVIFLGVLTTGSGPHSGDAKVEARFDFDPGVMARIHSLAVVAFVGILLAMYPRISRNHLATSWYKVLCGLVVIQALVGITQFATGLPAVLVAIHVALASSLWAISNLVAFTSELARPLQPQEISKTNT